MTVQYPRITPLSPLSSAGGRRWNGSDFDPSGPNPTWSTSTSLVPKDQTSPRFVHKTGSRNLFSLTTTSQSSNSTHSSTSVGTTSSSLVIRMNSVLSEKHGDDDPSVYIRHLSADRWEWRDSLKAEPHTPSWQGYVYPRLSFSVCEPVRVTIYIRELDKHFNSARDAPFNLTHPALASPRGSNP